MNIDMENANNPDRIMETIDEVLAAMNTEQKQAGSNIYLWKRLWNLIYKS
jgi:hypothetical protein